MKRLIISACLMVFLVGCSNQNKSMDRVLGLRKEILESTSVTFDAAVTADYTDEMQTFSMYCVMDDQGDIAFCVTSPQTIEGITGKITSDGGNLTFDNEVLAFSLLADDRVAPISAPWILMKTLRSGYIKACEETDDGIRIMINDSYEEDALQLNVFLNDTNKPCFAELIWNNQRIISIEIENFCCM